MCGEDHLCHMLLLLLRGLSSDTQASVVVAPYPRAFSSSVVARAKLFGKPVIVTDVGGLADQVDHSDIVLRSPAELSSAMCTAMLRCGSGGV